MTQVSGVAMGLIDTAEGLKPMIREYADQAERECRLPRALSEAFLERGLFRMWLPTELGGDAVDPVTTLKVVEVLAQEDASCAWAVMVANQAALFVPMWEEAVAKATFNRGDIFCLTLGLMKAVQVDGGYRVSGRASFASGSTHATWIFGQCQVAGADGTVAADGSGEIRFMMFPIGDVTLIDDSWQTTGMRGTGSLDWEVRDAFVPYKFASQPRPTDIFERWGGPLFRAPFQWPMRGAVALGMARHAIDAVIEIAQTKKPHGETALLRDIPRAQNAVGWAEAKLESARLYLHSKVAGPWETLNRGERLSELQRLGLGLVTVHTVTTCAEVVESMYRLGGGNSIYAKSPIERCFRDINTLMADQSAAPWVVETAGRAYLANWADTHPIEEALSRTS